MIVSSFQTFVPKTLRRFCGVFLINLNRIVEKLILHLFLFYGNGQLKQFC
ncbi:hypothetical protein LEP1GSC124_4268 [Leptospira interrogans serovar Pyrogenes str. 200701872]|uniref:Uncharacterized protein n=1 Tax=Leptospira interrogans serovar Pyrogenes str. 200701872 TaxID=1193029 RepID=M6ZPD7_LEPIR|nr:hypothetical protein LEP1GSC124_4268 [Leptospira interrogans serovar Pyrogenes str. 200701872]